MLPRVHRVTKGGKVYRWHRPTRTKLPDDIPETHPDFVAAWARAESLKAPPIDAGKAGSVRAEVIASKSCETWRSYSSVYKATLTRHLEEIALRAGDLPIAGLRSEHIEADLENLPANVANDRLKAWRFLCRRCRARGKIRTDPSTAVGRREVRTSGYAAWTQAEIAAFRRHHKSETVARLAFEIVFWTALRTVDAVSISSLMIGRDGVLTVRQSKTTGDAYIPWTAPLPTWARSWDDERKGVLACLRDDSMTFLSVNGRPRSVKGLGNLIAQAAREAGVNKSAHGLRKARLTMAAKAGASAHAIMAWGGHKSLAEAERYTRAARLKGLVRGEEQEQNDANLSTMGVNRRPKP